MNYPWEDRTNAWWMFKDHSFPPRVHHSSRMAYIDHGLGENWDRVAVLPWDLIRNLKQRHGGNASEPEIQAIIDAATGWVK